MVEHGLITELYRQAEVFFNSKFANEFRQFSTVQEYLDDYTSIMNLNVQNFQLLFELFALVQIVLCATFGVSTLLPLWTNRSGRNDSTNWNDRNSQNVLSDSQNNEISPYDQNNRNDQKNWINQSGWNSSWTNRNSRKHWNGQDLNNCAIRFTKISPTKGIPSKQLVRRNLWLGIGDF